MHRTTAPEDRPSARLEQVPRSRFSEVTVKLTLPWHLALLIERHGPELLAALAAAVDGVHAVQAAVRREASANDFAARFEHRRQEHARLAVQLYRRWRRALPDKPQRQDRRQVLVALAADTHLEPVYVETLIRRRRKVVQSYLRQRREATAARLYLAGVSDRAIARQLGCSRGTARRCWQAGVGRGRHVSSEHRAAL